MRYEGDIYSPHLAGDDYILQCTIGCSHNRCTFCDMYKAKRFRRRPLAEILADIEMARDHDGSVRKVFLGDGDALRLETDTLCAILDRLYDRFPALSYVGTYASPAAIGEKSADELAAIRGHGLSEAHLGVESGDDDILRRIDKGVDSAGLVAAGRQLKAAQIRICATVILGLAAYCDDTAPSLAEQSRRHATATAQLLNAFAPEAIGFLSVMIQPGTVLHDQYQRNVFCRLDDEALLREMRMMIAGLTCQTTVTSVHPSNALVIDGQLPRDKVTLLQKIDDALAGKNGQTLRVRQTATKV